MTAAHYKGGHPPGNDLGLHYTALPPIVASCPYSDQLLVTRKFWSPGANRPSQVRRHGIASTCTRLGTPPKRAEDSFLPLPKRRAWHRDCVNKIGAHQMMGELVKSKIALQGAH